MKISLLIIGIVGIILLSIAVTTTAQPPQPYGHWVKDGIGFSGPQPGNDWQPDTQFPYPDDCVLDEISKCLTKKGITVYVSETCSWCERQAAQFRDSWSNIASIDCSKQSAEFCDQIKATPTWTHEGVLYEGMIDPLGLAAAVGCDY